MFAMDNFLVPLATTFTHFMVYSVVYGISEGLFASPSLCIMLKSYAGMGFGWYISFQGVSLFTSPVLAGRQLDVVFYNLLVYLGDLFQCFECSMNSSFHNEPSKRF
ncbi:hypothetical protein QZH41_002369 [Actinostola sp. cb2023]|nr:hypothetical protein QZH41_002369 [Actinostola sp. cb2023]